MEKSIIAIYFFGAWFICFAAAIVSAQTEIKNNDKLDLPKLNGNGRIPIPKLKFDQKGELVVVPSAASSARDFDFLVGKWKLSHEKLKARLETCADWEKFESTVEDFNILEGTGNMDVGRAVIGGKPWEGRTLRLFNPKTRLWSLYWTASDTGVLDPPVVGSFENGVGHFFTRDTFKGRKIIMMFRWDARDAKRPIWSQAFSEDEGKTWEWNWYNVSDRID